MAEEAEEGGDRMMALNAHEECDAGSQQELAV